ncbi:kinase-like domain-containing protein [Blakeslea trispora]|nr:kinase-like domain-containing protein [Blakeslea trispora]
MPQQHKNDPLWTEKMLGDYAILSTIGHGSTGKVKLGIHQRTGKKVAIKIIPRTQLSSSLKKQAVERELAILQLLHHPNLIELYQVWQDAENIYFITEYVPGGELYYLLKRSVLSESDVKSIFYQIVSALSWCHTRHICHRDLKLENILIDKINWKIKIVDFGMANIQPLTQLLKTSCGSPHYASPEVVLGIPYYGPTADIWSAGVILYVLLSGRLPFDDLHIGRLLAKIKQGRYRPLPHWVSSSAKDVVYRMLIVDPNKRITANEILSHPWLLSSNSRAPQSTLSIHSFSFQSNPWQDAQLKAPLIDHPNDLDGPTRETLRVLWRGFSHEEIMTALRETSPNVQKLTFQLLQQRQKRTCMSRTMPTCDTYLHSKKPIPCIRSSSVVQMCHVTAYFCHSPSLRQRLAKSSLWQRMMVHVTRLKQDVFQKYLRLSRLGHRKRTSRLFSIDCLARSEFMAAGKLHYLLSMYFAGHLHGCMYPNGKILWSGRIDENTSFVCRINRTIDSKTKSTITFSVHQDHPDFAEQLQALFHQGEQDVIQLMKSITSSRI